MLKTFCPPLGNEAQRTEQEKRKILWAYIFITSFFHIEATFEVIFNRTCKNFDTIKLFVRPTAQCDQPLFFFKLNP